LLHATPTAPRQAPAKNVILLFLYGRVSQLDTLDPKPNAADDICGPFRTIPSRLPGVRLCEHLPRLASKLDRVALVRSMSHPNPIHGVAYAVTGIDRVDIPMELNRRDSRHWPFFGSVLDYLEDQDHPCRRLPDVPRTLHLPWAQSTRSFPHQRAGLLGGFLGPRYNPVVAEFIGSGVNPATYRQDDPFGGIYHLFGQSALQARRLVESGARLVSVFWDEFGLLCGAWDTHEKQTDRLSRELCPGFDQSFTALLDDLEQRGMLDEKLVLCLTEHGRTPQAERRGGLADGRGHWSDGRGRRGPRPSGWRERRPRRLSRGTARLAQGHLAYRLPSARRRFAPDDP